MNFATSILYEICSSSMLCFACLLTNVENVLDFQIAQIKPEKEKVRLTLSKYGTNNS